jgi:8-oxo-dGTP pyrophosphatase MutT (NUDIX family)
MKKGIDFIGISIVFFCHDGKGNVVLGKRGKKARDENGTWDIGGGGLEFGDSVEKRLKKEIREEYGLRVQEHEFLGFREVKRKYKNKLTHWVALDFKVLINPKFLKNKEPYKFDEVKMFPFNKFPKPLHSQLPLFLKKYRTHLI